MIGREPPYLGYADEGARRALARRRRRRRIRLGLVWSVVALLFAGACLGLAMGGRFGLGYVRTHTNWLEVRQVDVDSTLFVPPWEVVDLASVRPGDDFLDVNPDSVAARVRHHPRIAQVRVEKDRWRRTVHIQIAEKPPVAVWLEGGLVEVAADGTILGMLPARDEAPCWPLPVDSTRVTRGTDLPLLTGVDSLMAGGGAIHSTAALQALEFLRRLESYEAPGGSWVSEVRAEKPAELTAVTLTGVSVRIGDGRLGRRAVEALRTVLDRVREDGNAVQYLDARFRNQVIVKGIDPKNDKEGGGPDA